MKNLIASFVALTFLAGMAIAGPIVVDKTVLEPIGCECFLPGFQLGGFASGWAPNHTSDNGIGGGVSLGYFFTDRVGLDYSYAVHSTDQEIHINALDLVYRMPLGYSCWAPYLLLGGGVMSNGDNNGLGRLGGGLEYRFANCSALFVDGIYNWVKDHGNGTQVRVGLRFPF